MVSVLIVIVGRRHETNKAHTMHSRDISEHTSYYFQSGLEILNSFILHDVAL
jgi:hypothetical protein